MFSILMSFYNGKSKSWLRDEIFSGFLIPNPDPGDFLFWARSKSPGNSGFLRFSGHRDFFGIFWKISGIWDFFESRDFSKFRDFHPRNFREIPRIRDFSKFRDFNPRDFSKIPGIYGKSPGFGIFSPSGYLGDFLSPGSGFFQWDGISRQKANSCKS